MVKVKNVQNKFTVYLFLMAKKSFLEIMKNIWENSDLYSVSLMASQLKI